MGYGICIGCLGAVIPQLASKIGCSEESLGVLFTMRLVDSIIFMFPMSSYNIYLLFKKKKKKKRGIGYLVGTTMSVGLISYQGKLITKEIMFCIGTALLGLTMIFLTYTTRITLLLVIMLFQGTASGGCDVTVNCYIIELWGARVPPWMQALHAMFGIGK